MGRGPEQGGDREPSREGEGWDGWWMRGGLRTKDHAKVLCSCWLARRCSYDS